MVFDGSSSQPPIFFDWQKVYAPPDLAASQFRKRFLFQNSIPFRCYRGNGNYSTLSTKIFYAKGWLFEYICGCILADGTRKVQHEKWKWWFQKKHTGTSFILWLFLYTFCSCSFGQKSLLFRLYPAKNYKIELQTTCLNVSLYRNILILHHTSRWAHPTDEEGWNFQ